jgi:hypothetical protein
VTEAAKEPIPSDPEDHGVEEEWPDQMQVEPARLLANDARAPLRDRGFDDDQIDSWARTYVAEEGSGDLDTFLRWVEDRQED